MSAKSASSHPSPAQQTNAAPLWLLFTVWFANFAEAMAEGRGQTQRDIHTRKLAEPCYGAIFSQVSTSTLRKGGDVVLVEAGDVVPSEGEAIEDVASVKRKRDHGRERSGDSRYLTIIFITSGRAI